jgi:hypothetical protein
MFLHTANGNERVLVRGSEKLCSGDAIMQQTISREEQKVQDQRTADSQLSAESSSGTYERFLRMPVPVVLAVLWLVGAAFLSVGVLTLYTLGMFLASVVAGV